MAWVACLGLGIVLIVFLLRHRLPSSLHTKTSARLQDKKEEDLPQSGRGKQGIVTSKAPDSGGDGVVAYKLEVTSGDKMSSVAIASPQSTTLRTQEAITHAGNDTKNDRRQEIPATSKTKTPSQLMPPPVARPIPRNPLPASTTSHASSLRAPANGLIPNRFPASTSLSSRSNGTSSSLSPASTSTLAPSARPRKKVILQPGHSPLDWASLMQEKSARDLSGVPYPQRITPSQLAYNTGRKGKPAWSSYQGKVYNIGPYLPFHPGGEGELMRAAGKDGTKLFEEIHPWVNWENMMGACLVGFLVPEGKAEEEDMEEQD